MEIYTKAKELADAIATSEELRAVKDGELKMMLDLEAREIVEQYQTIQVEAMNSGINYEDLPEDQKKIVEELEVKMNSNETITNFLSANHALEQILQSVNMIISAAINGQESGCGTCNTGGSCGTAGGSCGCGSSSSCGH